MTATMRAVVIDAPGGPNVLHLRELPIPIPGPGQVLIRVEAFGLNRSELHFRRGMGPFRDLPTGARDRSRRDHGGSPRWRVPRRYPSSRADGRDGSRLRRGLRRVHRRDQKIQVAREVDRLSCLWGFAPYQVLLAWSLSRPAVASVIVGPE